MSYPETVRRRSDAAESAQRAERARAADEARQNELRSQRDRATAQANGARTASAAESPSGSDGSLFDRMRRRAIETVTPALQTAANAVGGAMNNAPLGLAEGHRGAQDGFDPNRAVQQLNSDGDRAYLRITAEAKGEAVVPTPAGDAVKVGLKGQYGNDIAITQNGDGAEATFTVRTERHSLAALIGSVAVPGTDNAVKGERGVQTYDAVEMTFATREEAARAAGIMQRMALADLASDALGVTASAAGPTTLPTQPISTASEAGGNPVTGGSNPLANPLTESGAPGETVQRAVGVSADDAQFLQEHITAYEQTLNNRDRIALEAKLPEIVPGQPGLEGRLDGRSRMTRRVELPTEDAPGSVTYTVRQDVRLSAKEKLLLDGLPGEPVIAGVGVENRLEIGRAEVAISARFELPPGADITQSPVGGRHVPEYDLLREGDFQPDRITAEINTDFRTQGPTDLSRGNGYRAALRLELNDPAGVPEAVGQFIGGDPEAAARAAGARVTGEIERVERTGMNVQAGPKVKIGFSAEATVILESGIDDVTGVRRFAVEPGDQAQAPGAPAPEEAQPTLVVVPRDGLTLRDAPAGERTSVFQNGTFLTQTGEAVTDAEGRQWIPVSGTDVSDTQVQGFVQADYVRAHDGALGAMDATGRTNPTLANQRYDTHQVVQDDNLWDLSRKLGVDFDEMLALNRDHIIAPELIFAGDTVYIPGTARGPAPTPPPAEPQPTEDATSSVTTESEGTLSPAGGRETGWTGDGGAEPSTTSPGQPDWHPPLVPVPGPDGPTISPQTGGDSPTLSPGGTPGGDPTSPTPVAQTRPDPAADPSADPAAPPVAATPGNRPDLARIERDFQVEGDPGERIEWRPVLGGSSVPGFVEDAAAGILGREQTFVRLLPSEVAWLDRLNPGQQVAFAQIGDDAQARARSNFPMPNDWQGPLRTFANDGHLDAFRHTYWAARLTREYGADWARSYLAAHEADPANEARREAMDGYNNELGVQLALDNPDASPAELERLALEAVQPGRTVVIDGGGNLAWSDQVAVGGHGAPPRVQAPGVIPVPVPGDTDSPG